MKKWFVCKYGPHHIQSPLECQPIGIAFQKTENDKESDFGFVDMSAFSAWLIKKNLCAFGEGYKRFFDTNSKQNLPIMYSGR